MRLLVAEDDPVMAGLLADLVRARGHEVETACDGAEAWQRFDERPARILICDWVMPGLSGPELCEKIRHRPRTEYCYIIMITGVGGKRQLGEAVDSGADDFLLKPINEIHLSVRLRVAERIIAYMTQINTLERLLPMCSYCRKINDDEGGWSPLDDYMRKKGAANFSHGICPDCLKKYAQSRINVREEAS